MTDHNAAEQARQRDEHIKKLVDAAPPLTPEQRSRLAILLHSPSSSPGDVRDAVRERVRDQVQQARKSSVSDVVDEL